MSMSTLYRLLLDDAPADGGDPTPTPKDGGTPVPHTTKEEKAPSLEDMQRKIQERGVEYAAKMLLEMSEDNFKYRSELREFKNKLPDGAVVLRDDDARAWEAYRQHGRPSDIARLLAERGEYESRLKGIERERTLSEVATLHGYKPSVLQRFAKADGLEVVIDDSKDQDGKPVRKGFVVTRGDDGQEAEGSRVPLDQYAETHWKDELEALREPSVRPKAADRKDPMRPVPKDEADAKRSVYSIPL